MQNQVIIKIIDFIVNKPLILTWIIIALVFLYIACLEIEKSKGEYSKNKNSNIFLRILDFTWRKKYLWLIFCAGLIGALYLIITGSSKNDHLIFYTLLAIFWYSRETMDLKQISNKQTERLRIEHKTNLRPYLRLQKGGERGLILVNEGKGVAVNLRPVYKNDSVSRGFLMIPAMAAAPGSITTSFVPAGVGLELDPSVANFTVEINYKDIEDRNYFAQFKSNPLFNDGFEIIKQKEV